MTQDRKVGPSEVHLVAGYNCEHLELNRFGKLREALQSLGLRAIPPEGQGPGEPAGPVAGKLSGKGMQALEEIQKSEEALWRLKAGEQGRWAASSISFQTFRGPKTNSDPKAYGNAAITVNCALLQKVYSFSVCSSCKFLDMFIDSFLPSPPSPLPSILLSFVGLLPVPLILWCPGYSLGFHLP